ncbi:ABC transporter permease [Leisingera sp. ANG-Vp]|uniref:ABC transporter permease n=1 Tax=Leisingera sp. ANG-Vp TaxID=1577896 RepID=UPI0005806018|nr:ABC transporter permease [Leisingera sp. ANG-Vp]KIC20145.1 ABC transporter permease [Leisingera sp. ANG-Vp]
MSADAQTERNRWLLLTPALTILTLAAAGPLLIVVVYSFLTAGDYGGVVWTFSTDAWFSVVAERDFFDETLSFSDAHLAIFWRSVKLSLMTTAVAFLVGFPTAYFIATRPARKRDFWMLLIMIPFWTNLLIRTFAVMEIIRNEGVVNTVLMKLGLIEAPIQMMYTEFAVTLGMFYVFLPLMVLPIYASMERMDFSLVEAAYDLYASRWKVLRRVILPLIKPGAVAGSILVFVPSLGAYVTPRIMGGGKQLMLGNLIELQFGQGRNWPLGAALSITLLAIVMVALIIYVRSSESEGAHHG